MTMDPTQPVTPAAAPSVAPAATPLVAPGQAPAVAVSPAPAAPVAPVVAVAPRRTSGGILNILLVGAAILAIGGVAFAIGRATAPAGTFQRAGAFPGGVTAVGPDGSFAPGAGGPGRATIGGEMAVDGTVKSIDADSVTLTLENGDEMTFKLDPTTTYREATDAAATDVGVGDEVSVKVAGGGRFVVGGDGAAPDLIAHDVTVAR